MEHQLYQNTMTQYRKIHDILSIKCNVEPGQDLAYCPWMQRNRICTNAAKPREARQMYPGIDSVSSRAYCILKEGKEKLSMAVSYPLSLRTSLCI